MSNSSTSIFHETAGGTVKGSELINSGQNTTVNKNYYNFNIGVLKVPDLIGYIAKPFVALIRMNESTGADGRERDLVEIISIMERDPSPIPVTSIADRYTRSMLGCLVGYPLYEPEPFSELSTEYLHNGINNDLINPSNFPAGFCLPEQPKTRNIRPLLPKTCLFQPPIDKTESGEYICTGSEGAILVLPEGGIQEETINKGRFEELAKLRGVEWYEYTKALGRSISNGSLYLVTSFTKCTQWGIAVFDRPCNPGQGLTFVSCPSGWKGSSAFPTRVNQGDISNQCVFLRGYKIMLRSDIFDKLPTRQPAQRIRGGGGTGFMSGIKKKIMGESPLTRTTIPTVTKSDEVILHANFNTPPVHPSDLINAELLSQNPNAKVAITHDDVWCDLLRDNCPNLNYTTLVKVARSYTSMTDEYDCVSLKKNAPGPDESSKALRGIKTPSMAGSGWPGISMRSGGIMGVQAAPHAMTFVKGGETIDNNYSATPIGIGPGSSFFDNVIHGGEFYNANRDVYKIVINSGHDIMETIQAAVPVLLEEIQKIQFTTDGIKGTDGFPSDNGSLQEASPVVVEMAMAASSSLEIRSVADRYTRSMLKCLAGYPLYTPQPSSGFLEEVYSRRGVCVGDVGIVTKDGAFDFLFNICPSQNSLINPRRLPKGFTLETSEDARINCQEQFPAKSHVFERPVKRTNSLLQGPKYTSSESGGAILELPEGASQDDATSTFPFRRLASRYGEQWYKYAIGTRGKEVLNGSLYLVTSSTKCTQWGIAVFDLPCTPRDSLRFVQNKGLLSDSGSKYRWKGSGSGIFTTKVAPEGSDSENQCVFVQGYKIMLDQDLFINLRNELLRQPPQASLSSRSRKSGTNLKQQRVLATRDRDDSGPDPSRRRQVQRPRRSEHGVSLHSNSNLPPAHPSDLINSALLKQKPGARVALTHDNDWRDIVKDIFDNLENLDLSKIANSYGTSAVDENGCIYFEKIPDKSLVIAIDVGTTFSGVSYSLLEPGKKPRIRPVTRFAGQNEGQGNSKVPSVVCYDQYGNFIAAGSEADPETNPLLSDMNGVRRAEWFKLRLHLSRLTADQRAELQKLWLPPQPAEVKAHDEMEDEVLLDFECVGAPIREPEMHFIPVTDDFKNPIQVFADFLRYLFKSAKKYIIEAESNLDPTFLWTSVERNIYFVLTHPNGWEKEQQSKMREAAVAAGLVKMSTPVERITFLTKGEANIRFCLEKNPNLLQEQNGLLVVDCGGGTIDLSAYALALAEEGNFRELAPPGCLLQGSIFVTSRARDYFKGRFMDSEFGSDDDVEAMARAFDKPDGVKCMFSNPNIPYYVKFGGLRDTDPDFGIHGGKFRLEGAQVASFFEPAVNDIIDSIIDQCDRAKWNRSSIKIILLVGSFGSSGYLYTRLDDYFRPKGITVHRLDSTQLNTTVADGAVSYYLERMTRKSTKRSI